MEIKKNLSVVPFQWKEWYLRKHSFVPIIVTQKESAIFKMTKSVCYEPAAISWNTHNSFYISVNQASVWLWSPGYVFNQIGNGSSGWRKSFCLLCLNISRSRRCLYLSPPIYIYLSPPHEYRQNLRKSRISRVGRNRGPICFEHIGFEFIRKLGPICGGWRGMLGISDSLFTICQWRLGGFCRRKQKLAEEDGSGQ